MSLSAPKSNDPADPFGRWSSPAQETQAFVSVSSSNRSSQVTSNSPVKPFEDNPKLWPDQKMPISEFATIARPGVSAIVQAPEARADQSQAAPMTYPPSLNSQLPSVQLTGEPARFGGTSGVSAPFEAPFAGQASSVVEHSAPRVDLSSASRRAPMGTPNPPSIPASPLKTSQPAVLPQAAPERPRQFIFQPAKKA